MNQLFLAAAALGVIATLGMFILSLTASRPTNLGADVDGKLAEVPDSPNCVSSQTSKASHWIAPIGFQTSPTEAKETLRNIVAAQPGSTIVTESETYVYAEFRSTFFRFVDDVEFVVDPESSQIHVRSASRVGHSDLGVNRKRIESIRAAFQSATSAAGDLASPKTKD